MPPKDRRRLLLRNGLTFAGLLIAVVALAILTTRESKTILTPPSTPIAGEPSPWASFAITVSSQSITPQSLTAPSGVPIQFVVSNQGDPCPFSVGPFLGSLLVPQGQTDAVTFVVPGQPESGSGSSSDLSVGCLGQEQRQAPLTFVPPTPGPPAAATEGQTSSPRSGERVLLITLQDGAVQPKQVDLHAQVPLHLVLANKGGEPCLFYFGNYLHGLPVPQHGFADVSFTPGPPASGGAAPSAAASSPSPVQGAASSQLPPGLSMGCLGDAQRQGRLSVS